MYQVTLKVFNSILTKGILTQAFQLDVHQRVMQALDNM